MFSVHVRVCDKEKESHLRNRGTVNRVNRPVETKVIFKKTNQSVEISAGDSQCLCSVCGQAIVVVARDVHNHFLHNTSNLNTRCIIVMDQTLCKNKSHSGVFCCCR